MCLSELAAGMRRARTKEIHFACKMSLLFPLLPSPSIFEYCGKKRRECHQGARWRILCVLLVTQQSSYLKCEAVLLCVWVCVRLHLCAFVCITMHACVTVCVVLCECHATVSSPLHEYVLFALVCEPWELGSVSAVSSSSEGELLCFSALCWIPFQPDTIPQSHSSEPLSCSLHRISANPQRSHTHPDHCFNSPGSARCQRLHRRTQLCCSLVGGSHEHYVCFPNTTLKSSSSHIQPCFCLSGSLPGFLCPPCSQTYTQ